MNKFSIFLLLFTAIVFISCSDDDEKTEIVENEANYFALKVGNSWTYNVYRYNGGAMEYEETDLKITNSIVNTETINGEIYFTFETTSEGITECQYCIDDLGNNSVRDSLGYLVDTEGAIKFSSIETDPYLISSENFGDIFGVYRKQTAAVDTPAGEFFGVDYNERYLVQPDGTTAPGKDGAYYGKEGQGLVVKTVSFVSSEFPNWFIILDESNVEVEK